jgi:hypothetical protein
MEPVFLVSQTTVHANGDGVALPLGPDRPSSLLVTLGIMKTVEQELLQVFIQGSRDGSNWSERLAVFPEKFYVGVSSLVVDLSQQAEVEYVRAQWRAVRWGRGDKTPVFEFYVFAEPV